MTDKNTLTARLGLLSALLLATLFILYIVCFAAILLNAPLYTWKGMEGFLAYNGQYDQTMKYVSYFGMLLFGSIYVVLLNSINETVTDGRKPLARLGLYFGLLFAAATGINYFVQMTTVRFSITQGTATGLEQLIQGNPQSAMAAINMLGWTLFLGLSSLFAAFSFDGGSKDKAVRLSFLANGIVCLLAGVGYVFDIQWLVALCMYPLLGGAVLSIAASCATRFRRINVQT